MDEIINRIMRTIKTIPTKTLRKTQTLVSQETFLFNDTILNNIKIGNIDASLRRSDKGLLKKHLSMIL